MSSAPARRAFHRQIFAAYLLLWPPLAVLLLRRSGSPDVLERWSWRLFAAVVVYLLVLAMATVVALTRRPGAGIRAWLLQGIFTLRRNWFLYGLALVLPIFIVVLGLSAMRWIGVLPDAGILVSICAAVLLAGLCTVTLVMAGRPAAYRRELAKKLALAVGAGLTTLAAVEVGAAILGIGTYVTWDLNPKQLDIRFTTDDFDVHVATNAQGLREPGDVARRHPGTFRIVAIGDSMTFGWGVEYAEAYPKVAERVLRELFGRSDLEVINMGRPGAGPHDYLAYLRKYAAQLDPDLIVVGFLVGNDCPVQAPATLQDREAVERALARYVSASRQSLAERWLLKSFLARLCYAGIALPQRQPEEPGHRPGPIFGEPNPLGPRFIQAEIDALSRPDAARQRYAELRRGGWIEKGLAWRINPWLVRSMILNPGGAADSLAVRDETQEVMRHEWALCAGLLRELKAASDELPAPMVVLAIPNAHLVSQCWVDFLATQGCFVTPEMTTSQVVNDWLAETCQRNKIPCVDPLHRFRAEQAAGAELYLKTDDHMTPRGQELLGNVLAAALDPFIEAEQWRP